MWPVNEYAYNLFATSFHAQFIVNRFAFDIFCHLYVCSACVCTHFLVLIKLSLIIFDANAQLLRNVLYKWWPQQASKQPTKQIPTICPAVYRLHLHTNPFKPIRIKRMCGAKWSSVRVRSWNVCVARVCAVSLNWYEKRLYYYLRNQSEIKKSKQRIRRRWNEIHVFFLLFHQMD